MSFDYPNPHQRPVLDWRGTQHRLDEEAERALRYHRELTVFVLDVGKTSPDLATKITAACARAIRFSDVLGESRDGEPVVIFPETGEQAKIPVTRVLTAASRIAPDARGGIARCPHNGTDGHALLTSAKQAAARAKAGSFEALPGSTERYPLAQYDTSIIAADPATKRLFALVRNLARADLATLISGETGVGKEVVATALHCWSNRQGGPFIAINCAGIPVALLESELFGYEKGAFSGADGAKVGLIESADGGTLFLDEISEAPAEIQAKLLRVLESHRLRRLGATEERGVDVRFVAATNRAVSEAISEGHFRKDLYYRLCTAKIEISPLRERRGDIMPLARSFIDMGGQPSGSSALRFTEAAIERLETYTWPGNVRELRNLMTFIAATHSGPVVDAAELGLDIDARDVAPTADGVEDRGGNGPLKRRFKNLKEEIRDLEKRRIREALIASNGVRKQAATLIGMPLRTLVTKMKVYDLGSVSRGSAIRREE